jgi:hypothetical protein
MFGKARSHAFFPRAMDQLNMPDRSNQYYGLFLIGSTEYGPGSTGGASASYVQDWLHVSKAQADILSSTSQPTK